MTRNGTPLPAPVAAEPGAATEITDSELLARFAERQDPAAFATLIDRHGPMVLAVCRRVLNHEQEAEDAFQLTFVILVRRAAALQRPELLGNWLYGVAYRTAQKARVRLARRRACERRALPMVAAHPSDDLEWREVRGILDEELRHLPHKYRAPLVLCYLEGMTNEEAARRLGWPAGSISYRLARGRQLLGARLRRRERRRAALMLPLLLQRHAGPEEVPEHLARATLHAALGRFDWDVPILPLRAPRQESDQSAGSAGAATGTTPRPPRPPRRRRLMALLALLTAVSATGVTYLALSSGLTYGGGDDRPVPAVAPVSNAGTSTPLDAPVPSCCH